MLARCAVIVCLLAAACASSPEGEEGSAPPAPTETAAPAAGDGTLPPGTAPQSPPADGPPSTSPPPTTSDGGGPRPAPTAAPEPQPRPSRPELRDDGPLGSMAQPLLSPAIEAAVVEVDVTRGRTLTARAREALAGALREHGNKASISAAGASTVPAAAVYDVGDLRRLAAEHRATHSTGERISVYVLVLDGRFQAEGVTGVAFAASAFALFPETLGGGLLSTSSYARLEEAVTVHELGHLFGLVNLTGHGAFHEDPEHPGHSTSRESVMYWAVEDVSIASLFRGGPPTTFDADDVRELELIRAGG